MRHSTDFKGLLSSVPYPEWLQTLFSMMALLTATGRVAALDEDIDIFASSLAAALVIESESDA